MHYEVGSNLKAHFPVFSSHPKLVFLDNAASAQKPAVVLEAMDKLYRTSYANIHRGVYQLAEAATKAYEDARVTVARFINAREPAEIIFTRNATHALNTVAFGLAQQLKAGDEVLLTEMEHHANLVPWQQVAKRYSLSLKFIPVTNEGRLDLAKLPELLTKQTKIVAVTAMSNVLGTITELDQIILAAHKVGAQVVVDAAQFAPHAEIDVQALDCDFLAFSGHKVFGPTGIGVLYGKRELLEELEPFEFGGSMINEVTWQSSTWAEVPGKFEAGTPAIAEAVGLKAALEFVAKLGWSQITAYEQALTAYSLEKLLAVPGLKLLGPNSSEARGSVFSFTVAGVHPHDLASLLDEVGIAVRAGHHCAMPLHRKLGVPATTRASFTIYNTEEDVAALVAGIERARALLT